MTVAKKSEVEVSACVPVCPLLMTDLTACEDPKLRKVKLPRLWLALTRLETMSIGDCLFSEQNAPAMSPQWDGVWAVERTPADAASGVFGLKCPTSVLTYHIQCNTSPLLMLKLGENTH